MKLQPFHLRDLPLSLRLATTCFVVMIGAGYLVSLLHMAGHTGKKDDDPSLSMTDIMGTYHGVDRPAPIIRALDDPRHRQWIETMPEEEVNILRDWLQPPPRSARAEADPVQAGYDEPPPGAPEDVLLPADILEERCTRCHANGATEGGGIGATISLERWPHVRRFAYAKKLSPVSEEILATSTHTHVLSIPAYTFLACLLFLATRWPRRLRCGVVLLCFLSLLVDFAAWWLARWSEAFAYVIVGAGALYGASLGLALLLTLADLWLPRRS